MGRRLAAVDCLAEGERVTREESYRVELTAWRRIQTLIPKRHQSEFAQLFDAVQMLEADRLATEFARGLERGMAVERLSTLGALGTPGPDGEWHEAVKH